MTRRFSSDSESMEFGRTTTRTIPLSSSRGGETGRTYPIGQRVPPQSSVGDAEGDKEKQRRRIAVACSRCRKRKIKCSGDSGNGQGCQNCKNSGANPEQCQFLRVQSTHLADYSLLAQQTEWPYLQLGTPGVSSLSGTGLGPYHAGSSMSNMGPASFPGAGRFSRPLVHGGTVYLPEYYSYAGGETAFEPYSYSSSPQISCLPPQEASLSTPVFMNSDHVRQWSTSGPQVGRLGSNAFDDTSSTRQSSTLTPYLSTPTTSEGNTTFHGMGSLASYLPQPINDRTLPNPRSVQASNVGEAATHSSQVYVSDSSSLSKNNMHWVDRGGNATLASNSCMRTSSARSGPSHSDHEEASLAYEQLPIQDQAVPTEAASTASLAESHLTSASAASPSSIGDNGSSGNPYRSLTGLYAYSMSSGRTTAQQPSEGTLLSGQPYTPIPYRTSHVSQTQLCDVRKEPGNIAGRVITNNPLTRVGGPAYR